MNIIENSLQITNETPILLESLFTPAVLAKIEACRLGELDYLIIRGLPVSEKLPNTPTEIRSSVYPAKEAAILALLASYFGAIAPKYVEHTIRFALDGKGTNTETWHSHFQFTHSLFYCLRGDPNAKTYFLTASAVAAVAENLLSFLTTPYSYLPKQVPFALLTEVYGGYCFSPHIFGRSDLEATIKDLDLPDAVKLLQVIEKQVSESGFCQAVSFLLNQLESAQNYISYLPGDLVIVHEPRVIRYSPGYHTLVPPEKARWLLAVSVGTN